METTHTRLYELPGGLFLDKAPVYIQQGCLWQHKETAQLFAELRLKNIDPRNLRSVKVKLIPFNTIGALLGEGTFYTYTPDAEPNGSFGQDILVPLPEQSCAFGACVVQAEFADGGIWEPENTRAWHVAEEGYNPQAPTQNKKGR